MGLVHCVDGMLDLVPYGMLSETHEGTLECVVPIDLIECAQLVCVQRGVVSWCILLWGVLGWPVCHGIVGRVWLLTTSMWLIIVLVLGPIISSLPLLIVGGKLVGTVLLCEHLSQWSRWSGGEGLNLLHWWFILYLWGWWCHKCGYFPNIWLYRPSHALILLRWCRLCVGSCCSRLGHHSGVVYNLVLLSKTSSVAWLWCNDRWCQSRKWLLRD